MKTYLSFFVLFFLVTSCKKTIIPEPKNLIPEDEMVNIIYDLSLLEGIKTIKSTDYKNIKSKDFVYTKYKIDSVQFAKSTQFYAADIDKYKGLYDKVQEKIEAQKSNLQPLKQKN